MTLMYLIKPIHCHLEHPTLSACSRNPSMCVHLLSSFQSIFKAIDTSSYSFFPVYDKIGYCVGTVPQLLKTLGIRRSKLHLSAGDGYPQEMVCVDIPLSSINNVSFLLRHSLFRCCMVWTEGRELGLYTSPSSLAVAFAEALCSSRICKFLQGQEFVLHSQVGMVFSSIKWSVGVSQGQHEAVWKMPAEAGCVAQRQRACLP